MTTLHIQVISGLASRMRAVIGAIDWAKRHNAEVCVCWPWQDKSETLGVFPVWFSELFESRCSERRMPAPDTRWPGTPTVQNGELRCRTWDVSLLGVEHSPEWPHRDWWRPAPLVQQQIDAVDWPAGKVVGVQIRHALAQPTTQPVEWFLKRMAEIAIQWGVRFFLSCDAAAVEAEVREWFPDVICQRRTYHYDRLGIARAAADWFLLERCDWMLGSYNSSFSEFAGWLRGGAYLPGWGREGWMPGGRYEDSRTPAVGIEEALG